MLRSINAWTFPAETSVVEMARQAERAGFKALELVVADEGELTPTTSEPACRELARTLGNARLRTAGLATGLFWPHNYGSPDAGSRQKAIDLTLSLLDRAAWIGTDAILVIPAVVGRAADRTPTTLYADALNRTYDALAQLRFEAEDRGVRIAVENVWNRFLLSPVETANLIDRLATPWVGVYFDTGNVMPFGYPEDWIATLGSRIVRVHIKDYALARPGPDGFCPLGDGDVNWPAVITALKTHAGYKGPMTYEGPGDPNEIARRLDTILRLAATNRDPTPRLP